MGTAILLGLFSAASLLIGALVAFLIRPQDRATGWIMAFGSGALISGVAYGLILEAFKKEGATIIALGLGAGAITFYVGDLFIDRFGGKDRKKFSGAQSEGSALAIGLGALLDGVPESFVIGIILVAGPVRVAVIVSIFISNLAESISATSGFEKAGWPRKSTLLLWTAIVIVSGIAAGLGFILFADPLGPAGAFANAFASGAILVMLADTMIPEAFELSRESAGLVTILGFALLTALSL